MTSRAGSPPEQFGSSLLTRCTYARAAAFTVRTKDPGLLAVVRLGQASCSCLLLIGTHLNSLLVEHMLLADYRKNGAAFAHGHRGRKPANAIPEATRSRVVHLARTPTTPIYQNSRWMQEDGPVLRSRRGGQLTPPSDSRVFLALYVSHYRDRRFDGRHLHCPWSRSCASSTAGEWPGTTP